MSRGPREGRALGKLAAYKTLLTHALGEDVTAFAVQSPQGPSGGGWDMSQLLPSAWRVVHLPPDPVEMLYALVEAPELPESDHVFVALPWMPWRQLPGEMRLHEDADRLALHELALLEALRMGPTQTATGFVPYASLTSSSSRDFRERLLSEAHPDTIIVSDGLGEALGTHPAFQTATMICQPGQTHEPVTRFFKVPHEVAGEDVTNDFQKLLRQGGGETKWGYVLRRRLPPDASLSYELRAPELERGKEALAHLGELRRLSELFEIVAGLNPARDRQLLHEAGDGPVLVKGSHVGYGTLDLSDVTVRVSRDYDGRARLQPGDVVFRSISSSVTGRLALAEVPEGIDAVASDKIVILRPRTGATPQERRFVRAYLETPFAFRVVSADANALGGHIRVLPSALAGMLVPVPDPEMATALRELDAASAQLRTWQEEADAARLSLFDRPATETRANVLVAGQRVRERVRAAARMDDLGVRIRVLYPHPVAFRWRTVEAASPDLEGYKQLLESAEVLITYVGVMACVTARKLDVTLGRMATLAARLSEGGGLTLGDWQSLLVDVRDGHAFRSRRAEAPFPELYELWRSDASKAALDRIRNRRNDQAHLRGPSGPELPDAFGETREDLTLLLRDAEFLADYPLRLIESTRWREVDESLEYRYRELRGDHPLVPIERGVVPTHRVEAHSLYFATRAGELLRATPYVIRRSCPDCGVPSTFAIDRYDRTRHTPLLKALEHGHAVDAPDELAHDLRHVGLLA